MEFDNNTEIEDDKARIKIPEYDQVKTEFLKWRSPIRGKANPEDQTNPVWQWVFAGGSSGWKLNNDLNGPSSSEGSPCWAADRYGQTITKLNDGSTIYVGGEHEDFYDPDFYIYNDVIRIDSQGHVTIYGYPESIFPPTENHSANLVGNEIILIGNLSYPDNRQVGTTQVLILNLADYSIRKQTTTGDCPGWIHQHQAELIEGDNIKVSKGEVQQTEDFVENIDEWQLNIQNWTWTRLTRRNWPCWQLSRKDEKRNHLWEMERQKQNKELQIESRTDWKVKYTDREFELLDSLFVPNFEYQSNPVEDEYHQYTVFVDGVRVRMIQDSFDIRVSVDGDLGEIAEHWVQELKRRLEEIEQTDYLLEKVR